MKLSEAIDTISRHKQGYLVKFTVSDGDRSWEDTVPDIHSGEEPFGNIDDAMAIAKGLRAARIDRYSNFYITHGDGEPVQDCSLDNLQ